MLAIVVTVAASVITSGSALRVTTPDKCLPTCCAQGQILDPSGTRCLRDRSKEAVSDPCGRRDSFLPLCEPEEPETIEQQQTQFGPKRRLPIVEQGTELDSIRHEDVLLGLSRYAIKIHGGSVVEAFYAAPKGNGSSSGDPGYEIPSSFCVDPNNNNALLICPPVNLDREATVYKCCPFGKQLQFPIYSGTTTTAVAVS